MVYGERYMVSSVGGFGFAGREDLKFRVGYVEICCVLMHDGWYYFSSARLCMLRAV